MPHHYDIVILGAGNAGFGVSQIAHAAGKSIAFVESDQYGGTCPNRGCTPKKMLVAAANALHEIERAGEHGIQVDARLRSVSNPSVWVAGDALVHSAQLSPLATYEDRIVGHHGEELIHLFALAMRHGISADQLGDEMYALPTFAADIKSML